MAKLLKKEFVLSMHPVTPFMLVLAAMVLIPNYPYCVIFFYVSMAIFFTCLQGRENRDIIYTAGLPVSKRDVVKARIMFAVIIELVQLLIMIPFVLLSRRLNPAGNQAGMDANIALFAEGFIVYGVFNAVFFLSYYKNVAKVGASFIKSSIAVFVLTALDIASTYAVPFVRSRLDTADPAYLTQKLIFLATGAVIFAVLNVLTYKISAVNFEKQDLN